MRNIYDSVQAFQKLLQTEYRFVLGRKGRQTVFALRFDKAHCFHLMGLHYLKDVPALNKKRSMVFDDLAAGKIAHELVERSIYYDQVAERIHYMPLLEALLDSNDMIFKYNERVQKNSKIRAKFLLKNHMEGRNLFLFIDRDCAEKYFCRSFFPESTRDFTERQPRFTLLQKTKIDLATMEEVILFNRMRCE